MVSWQAVGSFQIIFLKISTFLNNTIIFPDMNKHEWTKMTASDQVQRTALASPLRLEILGLFTESEPLAIADMAQLMGRTAGSLYYHVGLLEKARLLQRAGSRPKGTRFEALYYPAAAQLDLEAEKGGEQVALALKTMSSAFRMAERDLEASFQRSDCVTEGPGRNALAFRMHLRASPKLLAGINKHLDAIDKLLKAAAVKSPDPSPDDQHLSLTLALLPLKGRGKEMTERGD
jgi:hypothetical protein